MMAAAVLIEAGVREQIYIYESNSMLGGKVFLSGGGHCNLTTALSGRKEILEKYTRGGIFLKFAINYFPPKMVREWFRRHGLETKVEKSDRVFPLSEKSGDVVKVFERILKNGKNLEILLNTKVKDVSPDKNGKFIVKAAGRKNSFDFLLIATGGRAGSGASGYSFAQNLGHTITELAPSLTSFVVKEEWCGRLAGLSLSDCRIECVLKNNLAISVEGDFLFTHFGISGPAVFSLSSKAAFEKIGVQNPLKIFLIVDKKKKFTIWDSLLIERIGKDGAKKIKNVFYGLLPDRLANTTFDSAGVDKEQKAAEISKKERQRIAKLLGDGIEINLISRKKGGEMVTAGGVSLDEVDPQTCESKKRPNLYFAGEVLNIDGFTGGFNLQNCWMTGRLAGQKIAEKLGRERI